MYLSGTRAHAGRVRVHGARRGAARAAGRHRRARARRRRLRERAPHRPGPGDPRPRQDRGRRRPPPRQHALRLDEPDRRRRVVDRRDRPRPPLGAGRAAHAGHRRGALRRARHRHRPLPVLEHDAEVVPARGRARRGRRRRARHLPQRLRDGAVREAEAAGPRARPRAAVRGRPAARLAPRAHRLRRGRRRGAVLRGDHRLPAPGRGRADGGADPRAAGRRRPDAAHLAALEPGRGRRVGRRAQGRRRRPPAGRGLLERALDRRDLRVHPA